MRKRKIFVNIYSGCLQVAVLVLLRSSVMVMKTDVLSRTQKHYKCFHNLMDTDVARTLQKANVYYITTHTYSQVLQFLNETS